MSIKSCHYDRLANKASRAINSLIEQAICKKLGLEKVNIYDYINRMSKRELVNGDTIECYLDGQVILTIRLVPKEGGIGFDLEHKFG